MSDPVLDFLSGGKAQSSTSVDFDVSRSYGTQPKLLDNLRDVESGSNAYAVNPQTKAMGPYQFDPQTAADFNKRGIKFNPFNEKEARAAADYYMQELVKKNGGDIRKAIAQYGGFRTKDPTAYVDKVMNGVTQTSSMSSQESPDPVLSFLQSGGKPQSKVDQIPGQAPGFHAPAKPAPEAPSFLDRYGISKPAENGLMDKYVRGPAEAALSVATGSIAPVIGNVVGAVKSLFSSKRGTPEGVKMGEDEAAEITRALTYQPRTESGRQILGTLGDVADAAKLQGLVQPGMPSAAGSLATIGREVPKPATASRIGAVLPGADAAIAAKSGSQAANSGALASVGAAGATGAEQARTIASEASQELQRIVDQKLKKGEYINTDVLQRQTDADSLPVPIRLTEGQATRDPVIYSREANNRGRFEKLSQRFNQQEKQLVDNVEAIRQQSAPDVFATDMPQHGEILTDAYKAKDAALNADIGAKYKALEDANGGQLPLDGKAFAEAADAQLHKKLLAEHVPAQYQNLLGYLKDGGTLNFEQFEALRTNLARTMRSAQDGNVRAAAGVLRSALEDMPMPENAAHLKPLADEARSAARNRFAFLDSDPAYKAVVRGNAANDSFIDKYIVSPKVPVKNVQTLKDNLSDNPQALQAMSSGVVKYLEKAAGADRGSFNQASYNKALEAIRPKLSVIFEPETRAQLEKLGRVAGYVSKQEKGMFVNNSNALVGAMAEGARALAEHGLNAKTGGIGGTLLRHIGKFGEEGRVTKRAFSPGAGLGYKARK